MELLRCVIIDDEPFARKEIRKLLLKHKNIDILGEAEDMDDAIEKINSLNPNLIFLDIDLGNNSGFDLLERIPIKFHIVFITAYNEFALRAFEVNALDYLMKPVSEERLEKCLARLGGSHISGIPNKLKNYDQILVSVANGQKLMTVNMITCIEAFGDYSRLYSIKRFVGTVHQTMKDWEKRLPRDLFIRIHRSYLVNINYIEKIIKSREDGKSIIISYPTTPLPISRRQAYQLKPRFGL